MIRNAGGGRGRKASPDGTWRNSSGNARRYGKASEGPRRKRKRLTNGGSSGEWRRKSGPRSREFEIRNGASSWSNRLPSAPNVTGRRTNKSSGSGTGGLSSKSAPACSSFFDPGRTQGCQAYIGRMKQTEMQNPLLP